MQRCQFVLPALLPACAVWLAPAMAQDRPPAAVGKPAVATVYENPGDARRIEFTLPFEKAMEEAKREQRLLFLKPIYGGMDAAGAKDYRAGSW